MTAPALVLALACPATALAGPPLPGPIHDSVARLAAVPPATPGAEPAQQTAQPSPTLPGTRPSQPRPRSLTRKILGGIAGGVGGMFLGGYLGAKIEGDSCNCDDPGFQGFLIGMPIGAGAGAFVGAKFF